MKHINLNNSHKVALNSIMLAIAVIAAPARADDFNWSGTNSSDWLDTGNWGGGRYIPEAADNAHIDSGSAIAPVIDGSAFTVGRVYVGDTGDGSLLITNGGKLSAVTISGGGSLVGNAAGSNGTITVTGAGSSWDSPGFVTFGNHGTGTLNIENGGVVTTRTGMQFGGSPDGTGTLLISGPGSTLNLVNYGTDLEIGNSGSGSLTIENGGKLIGTGSPISIGYSATGPGTGTALVTGAGSSLTANAFYVGNGGIGTLTIADGGQVFDNNGTIGAITDGANGAVLVTGSGSTWTNAANLTVGNAGVAVLNIENGGLVTSATAVIGKSAPLNPSLGGTVNVTGPGSQWIDSGALTIAQTGTGNLNVQAGGTVTSAGTAYIGQSTTHNFNGPDWVSNGAATVTGVGSSWTNAGDVVVGNSGNGALMVANSGLVSASTIQVAALAGSIGTLAIGAGLDANGNPLAPVAPGQLNTSQVVLGAGDGRVVFNHTDGSYRFNPVITGTGEVDVYSGATVLSAANTYSGSTNVAGGTLRAGAVNTLSANSDHNVASGGTLDLAGYNQTVANLANAGTVSLLGNAPGTELTVTGAYVGNNGTLRVGTALDGDGSASDRLILNGAGASASGHTNVQVTNLGGLGALTTGNGIEVVSAQNGATTTAQTTKDAFALAGGHVDAGAYEYTLHAADASGTGENWYLRSTVEVAPPVPPVDPVKPVDPVNPPKLDDNSDAPPPAPVTVASYRAEVPLLAALPAQLRQADLSMLGNLHQRIGDDDVKGSAGSSTNDNERRAWGRVISADVDVRQQGTVSPESNGRLNGFQTGTDLWVNSNWHTGVYVGQLEGDVSVNGFARGITGLGVGSNDLRSQYFGAYATYKNDTGFYVDGVLQGGRHRYAASPLGNDQVHGKGNSTLASVELGQSFLVTPHWKIEPQLQVVHQSLSIDDVAIPGALVQQSPNNDWLVRVGVRVKGEIETSAGMLQPYARVNVYRSSDGQDVAHFVGPVASTDIASGTGGTSTELAAGATLQLNKTVSLYGEAGTLFASGGSEKVKSGLQGSMGLRVRW